jgi:hypothetical protein
VALRGFASMFAAAMLAGPAVKLAFVAGNF